jgi:hypothetical protein
MSTPENPSQADFARILMEAILQAGETAELHYDPAESRLWAKDGGDTFYFPLSHAYAAFCAAAPADQPGVVAKYCAAWMGRPRRTSSPRDQVHRGQRTEGRPGQPE